MSTDLGHVENTAGNDYCTLTSFYGGEEYGPCIQLTISGLSTQFISMNVEQVEKLANRLLEWSNEHKTKRATHSHEVVDL